jgi:hypothetical protein
MPSAPSWALWGVGVFTVGRAWAREDSGTQKKNQQPMFHVPCGVLHPQLYRTPRRLYDVSVVTTKLYSNRCINIEEPSPCCKLLM